MVNGPVRVISVGKYKVEVNKSTPYYVMLDVDGKGECPLMQPCSEETFFAFLNSMLQPRKESCGMAHVVTVTMAHGDSGGH